MALTDAPPPGLRIFSGFLGSQRTILFHQFLVLFLTFIAYASFHASRKPPSIVKSILTSPVNQTETILSFDHSTGWPPFDGPTGPHRLGELDLSFLLSYAVGMYFAGHIGDSIDLRIFLTIGMIGSGIFVLLFGLGYFLDLHSFLFFIVVQILCGLFQSIGWPCVVAIVGNWCGKERRGLIMGIWSSNTSVGNIIGSVIASSVLVFGWGWSFVVPGALMIIVAGIIFPFLAIHPEILGFELPGKNVEMNIEGVSLVDSETSKDGIPESESEPLVAIGFIDAWRLPHVATYAFCLFFSKLVAYTFLYWLPFYIRHTGVSGVHLSHKRAGILSAIFDIGGVVGGISAGFISDTLESHGVTSFIFLSLSIPTLIFYRLYGNTSMVANLVLMFASGLLVNGPYSLIVTAVSADLGSQSMNARALATVTAIIDGTGSVGAAVGPLLAGYISTRGWNSVFFMLIVSIFIAACLLVHVVIREIRAKMNQGRWLFFSFFI